MILSILIHLEAISDGQFDQFTGRGVHGFWFQRWREVDEKFGAELHAVSEVQPFTLSPLLGLPRAQRGVFSVAKGLACRFRLNVLSDALGEAVLSKWMKGLAGQVIQIPESNTEQAGISWQVTRCEVEFQEAYEVLSKRHLMNSLPPRQWTVEFLTPTTFHGRETHLPFPLPDSLIQSWMRRWNAFAPIALPDEALEWSRQKLAVSSFTLKTLPAREADRLRVGCVGRLSLRALEMPPYLRAAIDLLAHYSSYCGSGSHTSQGLGQTRFVVSR
ncbi:MAG: CRISPR system precrRNA processing endoribonuclease RAMP protein Cas6 [Anaerolineales bacterium]|nr:CRISPR system precrRNA processing endoribonuclease RAMP protein Cas6 [Anaerolineales bacterium]